MSEPAWTKSLSSNTLCGWFYLLFIVRLTVFILFALALIYLLTMTSGSFFKGEMGTKVIGTLIGLIVMGTDALFLHILCNRSLQTNE
jgi:hypothetical protein